MIKKLIGLLAAAGIIAVLVFAILHRANYRSMLFDEQTTLLNVFSGGKSEPAADATDGPVFDRRTIWCPMRSSFPKRVPARRRIPTDG